MGHQGNVLLGYNLAILVEPRSKLPAALSARDRKLAVAALGERIEDEIVRHLRMRFCKKLDPKSAQTDQVAKELFKKYVSIHLEPYMFSIPDFPQMKDLWLKIGCDRGRHVQKENERGHVYVFVGWSTGAARKGRDNKWNMLRYRLRSADPETRIEEFTVTALAHSNDPLDLTEEIGKEDENSNPLYHIASRVCSALVEYEPLLYWDSKGANVKKEALTPFGFSGATDAFNYAGICPVEKILDVRDAVALIGGSLDGAESFFPPVPDQMTRIFRGERVTSSVRVRYKFPFGIWFRGSKRVCYGLEPSLFRQTSAGGLHGGCKKISGNGSMYDEASMVKHFRLHNAEIRERQKGTFEWLCLMQHYGMPTRILDWGENILLALYFAVCKENDAEVNCDGALWVLNAGRLNETTRLSTARRYACSPTSADVILRSTMACSTTADELRAKLMREGSLDYVLSAIKNGGKDGSDKLIRWINSGGRTGIRDSLAYDLLGTPVAVFPNRTNARLNAQLGTFTLHGGKLYDKRIFSPDTESRTGSKSKAVFPRQKGLVEWHLEHIKRPENKDNAFLDVYVIPSGAKRKIREQLKRMGIHGAALFPELEHQAKFIENQWRMHGSDALVRN